MAGDCTLLVLEAVIVATREVMGFAALCPSYVLLVISSNGGCGRGLAIVATKAAMGFTAFCPSYVLLIGSPVKAFEKLGWKAEVTVDAVCRIMVKADIARCLPGYSVTT